MADQQWLAERFEDHRPRLGAVAWRMLGSLAEAEGAWLRVTGPVVLCENSYGRVVITEASAERVTKLRPVPTGRRRAGADRVW